MISIKNADVLQWAANYDGAERVKFWHGRTIEKPIKKVKKNDNQLRLI